VALVGRCGEGEKGKEGVWQGELGGGKCRRGRGKGLWGEEGVRWSFSGICEGGGSKGRSGGKVGGKVVVVERVVWEEGRLGREGAGEF